MTDASYDQIRVETATRIRDQFRQWAQTQREAGGFAEAKIIDACADIVEVTEKLVSTSEDNHD